MKTLIEDSVSLGREPLEKLGFSNEDELTQALIPLMKQIDLEDIAYPMIK